MKKIAVLVSGGGTNLQALIDAEQAGNIRGGKLSLVLSSSPDAYALIRAEKAGIPTSIVSRKAYDSREGFTDAVMAELTARHIDLVVLAGFMYILSPPFCQQYENAVINVHPALTPSFCGVGFYGLRVHRAALEFGVKLSGATVHFINEVTDDGPIIMQKSVPVLENDTPETLQRRIMEQAEWVILPEAVSLFCEDRLSVEGRHVHIHPPA